MLAVVVLALTGRGGAGSAAVGEALPPVDFPDPGVVHVHGLGVDPGDQALYAATHSGLFRIGKDGEAVRLANRYQDTMGFEVAGPGVFLGSGHPDFREFDEPLLGLIRSEDAGRSWERVSLYGVADLHLIEALHDRVYAYDSTSETFLVSTDDGKSWDRRAERALLDVAVSPEDPELVLAAAEAGLLRSTDGGRTWTELLQAPVAAVLAGHARGLYAADAAGVVHLSLDGGTRWETVGDVGGAPEAIALHPTEPDVVFVAVADRGIVRSDDGGRTFTVVHAPA